MTRRKKIDFQVPQSTHANEKVRPTGQRPCPICKEPLLSSTERGTTVDLCLEHGVWLDRGELDQLLSKVAMAGKSSRRATVDKARRSGVTRGLFLGVWALLDSGPVSRNSPARRARFVGKVEPKGGPDNAELVPEGARPCPICDETMDIESIENLIVDQCDLHGLWLDADELEEMASAVRARTRLGTARAARAARHKGAVDANVFGIFALL